MLLGVNLASQSKPNRMEGAWVSSRVFVLRVNITGFVVEKRDDFLYADGLPPSAGNPLSAADILQFS